ncbi:MAG: toll/interleukin-1 receptor domain-containing protein [Acidobacteria bacterium]|nr:toll/interleukin-1 receptor domain-containing protein [Acidobacteriota bacterium]
MPDHIARGKEEAEARYQLDLDEAEIKADFIAAIPGIKDVFIGGVTIPFEATGFLQIRHTDAPASVVLAGLENRCREYEEKARLRGRGDFDMPWPREREVFLEGHDKTRVFIAEPLQLNSEGSADFEENVNMDVFISHSSHDQPVVKRLITLIRSALNLSSEAIRCTSVDGYRLPVGASVAEHLRQETLSSNVFIAVITPRGTESKYVLFELGARWGSGKPLLPLLACGGDAKLLEGPLSAVNALSCDSPGQLHQFIEEVAAALGRKPDRVAAFQKCIDEVVAESRASTSPSNPDELPAAASAPPDTVPAIEELHVREMEGAAYRIGKLQYLLIVMEQSVETGANDTEQAIEKTKRKLVSWLDRLGVESTQHENLVRIWPGLSHSSFRDRSVKNIAAELKTPSRLAVWCR